jgi:uncharacterized membrane protein
VNAVLSSNALRAARTTYATRIALITGVAMAARVLFLDHQPLWRDEAFTSIVVQMPIAQMLDAVRMDSAPPLSYLLQHFIAPLWPGPGGLRLLSVGAGTASVPIVAALARRVAGDRGGIAGAVLVAVAPAFVLTARDARMYALATTLVLASTLLMARAVERPSLPRWSLYAAVTTLALYTNYFVALAVIAQLIGALIVFRPGWRTTLTALAAVAVGVMLLVPWLVAARAQFSHASGFFWVAPVGFTSTGGEFVQFFTGQALDGWVPYIALLWTFQGLAAGAGVFAALALAWRWRSLSSVGRRNAMFLLACGLGALLLMFGLSVWRPLVNARYASVIWGPLYPLIGAGLALISARAAAAGLLATASASVALSAVVIHAETPAAVAWLAPRVGPGDFVAAYPTQYLLILYYGDPQLAARTHVVSPGATVDWFWGTAAYPPGAVLERVPESEAAAGGTVYYIAQPYDPASPAALPAGYHRAATNCWTGVCVTTYVR